ncbi:TPA: GAF domain-containing sensor histidine kinase [Legionella anisa]
MINSQEDFFIIEQIFHGIIDIAIAIAEADFGNIQLLDDTTQHLKIVAQRGFPQYWLNYWEHASRGEGSYGSVLEQGERIIIEDIYYSSLFGGESLEIQLRAGVRAIQSTPLINHDGKVIGLISTHYKIPHKPNKSLLIVLDILAKHAVDSIEQIKLQKILLKQKEELKEEVSIREEFILMLGHELKNSLTSSKINAQIGKMLIEQEKFEEIKFKKLFDTCLEQIETIEHLIETMLDTTAISEGWFFFNPQEIDLNELLMKITKRFGPLVTYKGTSVVGFWDSYRIEQIVINLITNGIKYGKGNPVNVALNMVESENLKIIVQDFGIGIAPENREKIFKKFERVDQKSRECSSNCVTSLII